MILSSGERFPKTSVSVSKRIPSLTAIRFTSSLKHTFQIVYLKPIYFLPNTMDFYAVILVLPVHNHPRPCNLPDELFTSNSKCEGTVLLVEQAKCTGKFGIECFARL